MPVAAYMLGARIVEKHFTLNKGLPGPDHICSATPEELAELAAYLRERGVTVGAEELLDAIGERAEVIRRDTGVSTDVVQRVVREQREVLAIPTERHLGMDLPAFRHRSEEHTSELQSH